MVHRTVLELLSQTELQRSAEHLKQLRLDLNIRCFHQLVCVITVCRREHITNWSQTRFTIVASMPALEFKTANERLFLRHKTIIEVLSVAAELTVLACTSYVEGLRWLFLCETFWRSSSQSHAVLVGDFAAWMPVNSQHFSWKIEQFLSFMYLTIRKRVFGWNSNVATQPGAATLSSTVTSSADVGPECPSAPHLKIKI